MKKTIAMLMAAAMVLGSLTACGSSKPAATTAAKAATTAAAAKTTAAAAATTAAAAKTTAAAAATTAAAAKADFPKKEVTIVVPYDAGGGVDITTRLLTTAMGNIGGQKIVIQNTSGGGGAIGQKTVLAAKPDGYTLLAYTSSVVNNPQLKEVDFTLDSFKPIVCMCFDPELILVPKDSPYKTMQELLEAAKKGQVNVSTSGAMTSHHVDGVKIQMATGAQFEYIHCDSASIQTQELVGGHTDAAIMPLGEIHDYINDGSVRALGIALDARHPDYPDIPTYKECGVDLVDGAFRGIGCSADVPADVYAVLCESFEKAAQDKAFIESMDKNGIPYHYMNHSDFDAYVHTASDDLKKVVEFLKK